MADDTNSSEKMAGVTVDRSGKTPVYQNNQPILSQLHKELSGLLNTGAKATQGGKTVDEAVDEAVKGAPGNSDY